MPKTTEPIGFRFQMRTNEIGTASQKAAEATA